MIVYPAIDLKDGKVVRLHQGDMAQQTVFSYDPVSTARAWVEAGAEWLHVVNLDGAFSVKNGNEKIVESLTKLGRPVQFGGGIRGLADAQRAFDLGVKRIMIGTLSVEQPELVAQFVEKWGSDAICVALDAKDGMITTRGWINQTGVSAIELGKHMVTLGVQHALYTDVSRDGSLTGVNLAATVQIAKSTGLQIIASGGVNGIGDVFALKQAGSVSGVILGRALYSGMINLQEAILAAKG